MTEEIVSRFQFNLRACHQGELIAMFMSELWKISEFCNYRDKLDEMLWDCLVYGINNSAMQRRLLAETDLTLSRALEMV